MGEELGWSYSQRRKQIADAVNFLRSMGLSPALALSSNLPEPIPKSWVEKIERSFWRTGQNVLGVVRWGVTSREWMRRIRLLLRDPDLRPEK
jgi:hypothetical protein